MVSNVGGQYTYMKLPRCASAHLHLPASIATHPLIVHPHITLSICKNAVWDIINIICKEQVVEQKFDAVESITVVEVNRFLHSMSGRNEPVDSMWPRWQGFSMRTSSRAVQKERGSVLTWETLSITSTQCLICL